MKRTILLLVLLSSILNSKAQSTYKDAITNSRKMRNEKMLSNTSPLSKRQKKKFEGLQYFAPDSTYRVTVQFQRTIFSGKTIKMKTSTNTIQNYVLHGQLSFQLDNKEYQLEIYQSPTKQFFLPFTDLSNGQETYEAGRYLDINAEDLIKATFYLDFNKAYNPYCAYSWGYTCPMPPPQNNIDINIKAGEKTFK